MAFRILHYLRLIAEMLGLMGAVFRPKDLPGDREKIIQKAVRDFTPDVKDDVVKILDSWTKTGSTVSEKKLKEIS